VGREALGDEFNIRLHFMSPKMITETQNVPQHSLNKINSGVNSALT
jgi:hypothetical protein